MTDQETATDPVAGAPEPAPAPEVAPEATPEAEGQDPAPEDAPDLDQPEVDPEPTAPETVEVEIGGLKFTVPKGVEAHIMKDADYTSKTQALAEGRKALESDRQTLTQQAEHQQKHLQDYGELAQTEKLLEQFREMDWKAAQEEDADHAQLLGFQFQNLRDQREQIVGRIQKREYDSRVTAEREHATRKDQLTATLARDIPDYSPQKRTQMDEVAAGFGFTPEEISAYAEPRHYQILNLAMIGAEVLKRQRAAKTTPTPEPVIPVPKAGGGRNPATGPTDKQGTDAWMRSRNQQLSKQGTA